MSLFLKREIRQIVRDEYGNAAEAVLPSSL
jgi:hypothetical protein